MAAPTQRQERALTMASVLLAALAAGLFVLLQRVYGEQSVRYVVQARNILFVSGLVCALAAVQAWLARLATEEAAAADAEADGSDLFDEAAEVGRHQRAARQFQRLLLPVVLLLISALEGWLAWRVLIAQPALPTTGLPTIAGVLAAFSVACFVTAKYASGVGYAGGWRYARPAAGVLLHAAAISLLGAVAALLQHIGLPGYGPIATWVAAGSALILAVERVLTWVVELYRPQVATAATRPVYESRLLALFAQPRGVVENLSELLHYQFGVRISRQLFAQFVSRGLVPFLCVQVVTLLLLSTCVRVAPDETGVRERWGSRELALLAPGISLQLPWPICRVQRVPTGQTQVLRVAVPEFTDDTPPEPPAAQTWDDRSRRSKLFLTAAAGASDPGLAARSLMTGTITVEYRITDARRYVQCHREPEKLLAQMAMRAVTQALLSQDAEALLRAAPVAVADAIRQQLAAQADTQQVGITVVRVGVDRLHPPPQIAAVYHEPFSAGQKRQQLLAAAERDAVLAAAAAAVTANQLVREAEGNTARVMAVAAAEAESYDVQRQLFRRYPRLYVERTSLERVERWLADARKIVIATDADREVINLELKERRPDLLDAFSGGQ
jgi:membrane protease subunit HflK